MNADPDCSGCICVRSCRSAAAANACNHSSNAEHLVPRVRLGPLDHVQRSCMSPRSNGASRRVIFSEKVHLEGERRRMLDGCTFRYRAYFEAGMIGRAILRSPGSCGEASDVQL